MADEDQVQDFIDRLSEDADLRDEFRESPSDVVERHGIELSDEQRERLESEDWASISDDDFVDRLNERGISALW